MKEIIKGLFLGNIRDSYDLDGLQRYGIVVIASCIRDFAPDARWGSQYIWRNYPLIDDGSDNVLGCLTTFVEDIDSYEALGKPVLVHCAQGVSRSVALVTGYLMVKQKQSFDEVYAFVQTAYPAANIADNFREQLQDLGDELDFDVTLNTQKHRLYRAKHKILVKSAGTCTTSPSKRFLCQKCKQSLFLDLHVLPIKHPNLLIECMQWMDTPNSEGPIMCPRCSSKIGYFNWSGSADNAFDGPVFIITKSKVDEMPLWSKHFGDSFPPTKF
jgi:dual specificity phosphatase 12